jgi:phosphate transport system substrate-binding protein
MTYSEHRPDSGRGGAALQPDWDRACVQQLPRVYRYFCGLAATAQGAEQLTTRAFELAWRVRKYYRREPAAFEARVLAIAHELGQGAAMPAAGSTFNSPDDPPAAFTARLRAHLQALELAEQWRARRLRLYGALAALLLAAVCLVAVPPISDSAQRLFPRATSWGTFWNSTAAMLHGSSKSGAVLAPAFETNLPEEDELWPAERSRRASLVTQSGTQAHGARVAMTNAMRAGATDDARLPMAQAVSAGRVRFAGSKLGLLLLSRKMAGLPVATHQAAFKRFCAGELDAVATSRPIPRAEVVKCASAGIEFIELPLAYAGVAVVVNHANVWADPLNITTLLAVLGDSHTAPAGLWSQLSPYWPEAPVSVYSLREGRGLSEYFDELLAEKSPNLMSDDFGVRRETVSLFNAVREDPHAIAVLPLGSYLEHAGRLPSLTKVARVFGWFNTLVRPDPQTIGSRYYVPLSRVVLLYVNAASARGPAVTRFVTDVLEHGAELANQPIFVALRPEEYPRALQKFQAMQRGTAFPADAVDGLTAREILQGWPNPRPK